MKRVLMGIALGIAAGVFGVIGYELLDQRIVGWFITALLLGIASQLTPPATGRWLWWGGLGGGIILLCWALNTVIPVPILVAWPLIGTVFGCLAARSGMWRRLEGCAIGFLAGVWGIGLLPLLTMIVLPVLGLSTTFDYDIDVLGLVVAGASIGGTTAWLRDTGGTQSGKNAKKRKKRGVTARGKKR
jgi:hypothetical protein